jgi:hypothetical protein
MSKSVHFRQRKLTHRGHFGDFPSQFTNATIFIHIQIDHGRQGHDQRIKISSPCIPTRTSLDDTISALTQLVEIFKTNFQKVKAPELSNAPIKAA